MRISYILFWAMAISFLVTNAVRMIWIMETLR